MLIVSCFLSQILKSIKQVNRYVVAQAFVLNVSDAYLHIYIYIHYVLSVSPFHQDHTAVFLRHLHVIQTTSTVVL
jgi:hypothetical protein